ncbi:hypothetical protein LTV02_15445 [Nocardia yamanashiensis]|uniref:LppU/SCO3897 family protein n=1 Tax=Nocardia yamanashiensis TaxID=209247 RepID=UPI001E3CE928|nr:hypothetical protein [Nocardia yamanashiensis]UGT44698.1 hypothetical protein LTV02_15445 [Nocardia yamanashiensis]
MQFRKLPGPYCKTCGLASFRQMTAESLVEGWWGPISFVLCNPVTILVNLVNRAWLNGLGEPIPGQPRLPLNPGKPLTRRWQVAGFLIPLLLVVAFAVAAGSDSSGKSSAFAGFSSGSAARDAKVGDCVRDKHKGQGGDPELVIVPCSDTRAEATVVGVVTEAGLADIQCGRKYPESDQVYSESTKGSGKYGVSEFALCLKKK